MTLHNKKILLGISGSIAAYKSAHLVRLLIKAGAEVRVLMTSNAEQFIAPLTLSTLSKHPVLSNVVGSDGWNNHVELGLWADALLVAPATANTLAKMANGICDNMISACYLSARCPVFFAPAMDLDMWAHPSTQANVRKLASYGDQLIDVEDGELASGLVGKGRMAEPEHIVEHLATYFERQAAPKRLVGKKVLLTSGPTYEALDPVRFIGNHSTGKMGIALAEALLAQGAEVILVTGPTSLPLPTGSRNIRVRSAQEMRDACMREYPNCDAAILAAAVADYTPKVVASEKIKKNDAEFTLTLVKTPDIAKELGALKREGQVNVGFALETNNELEHAKGKLERKKFDFIVLNSLQDVGAGFGHDTNKITLVDKLGNVSEHPLMSKTAAAELIVDKLANLL